MPVNNNQDLELPSGWVRVPLGEVVYVSKEKFTPSFSKSISYVGLEHIEKDTGKILGHGKSDEVSSTKTFFSARDLLYGRLRPYLSKVAIPDFDGVCSTDIIVFKKHPFLSNRFLKYALMNARFLEYSVAKTSGQHPRISTEDLLAYPLDLPPLAEQNRIVARLETLLEELNQTEAALQQAKAQTEEYRQAVLRDAFSGRLTGEVVEGSELPPGWKYERLGKLVNINPKLPYENPPDNMLVSFVPMRCVEEMTGKVDLSEKRPFNQVNKGFVSFMDGDVIFAKITPSMENGKVAIMSGLENGVGFGSTEFYVFRCREGLLNKYLYYYIFQEDFRNEAKENFTGSVGFLRVPKNFVEDYEIPLPPIVEQEKIIQYLEKEFSNIDVIKKDLVSQIEKSIILRQAILKDAFAGKLTPQDSNDEPATQLLERIKAEKIRMAAEQKQRDKVNREARKKAQEPDVLKTIVQVLKEKGGTYPAISVWRESEHKDDIEKFYAELKRLMESEKIVTEDNEKQNLILVQ